MKKLLKSKKGATLIEVIIASVIMVIVSISTMSFIVPNLKVYSTTTNLAEINTIVDNISEEILTSLAQSTSSAEISADGSSIKVNIGNTAVTYFNGTGENVGVIMKIYEEDDKVIGSSGPVLPHNYYKNKGITMNASVYSVATPNIYEINFTLTDESGATIKQRSVVSRPPIINQYN